jgi:hypothetical protein
MLALFDFLVCATAFYAFLRSQRHKISDILAPLGFLLIAGAAAVGTLRYAWFPELIQLHKWASALASVYGVPAIAAGFFLTAEEVRGRRLWLIAAVAILLPALLLIGSPIYALIAGLAAQVVWVLAAVRFHKLYRGLPLYIGISVVCVSVAGLVFGKPGVTAGIQNENWFHGFLALGIMQQALAFSLVLKRRI